MKVLADRQYTDYQVQGFTIAEGNVSVQLGNAELRMQIGSNLMRPEYRTLLRPRRRPFQARQVSIFQASSFRYNLVQREGQLNNVYGVIDLEEPLTNPLTNPQTKSEPAKSVKAKPASPEDNACCGLSAAASSPSRLASPSLGSDGMGRSDD